jgi:1,4-alpha-glucan branching enzyme
VAPLDAPVAALQTTIQFVFVAAGAGSVTVVGDFNDWDVSATPLVRSEGDGVWAVTVPLAPGRYRYSFLVDGTTWLSDPLAARTLEDEFGRPNSVLTIGGA